MPKSVVTKGSRQGKRKYSRDKAIKRAAEFVVMTHPALYALEALGENYATSKDPVDIYAVRKSAGALCDGARDQYAEAADVLAHLRHEAIPFLRKASDALDCLEQLLEDADYSDQGAKDKPSRLFCITIGKAMLAFVSEAGRWMERAEEALGADGPLCGWIDGFMHVDGLPDDGTVIRLDQQQRWFVRELWALNEQQRSDLAQIVTRMRLATAART
jgi:hypothetical protein